MLARSIWLGSLSMAMTRGAETGLVKFRLRPDTAPDLEDFAGPGIIHPFINIRLEKSGLGIKSVLFSSE